MRRCPADSRAPARRPPRASPDRVTSSAPIPGGPPNLWAATTMKSASGSGSLPALWAQSASSRPPAARTRAAISASGWITPVSLLTDWTATSGALAAAERRVEIGEVERAVAVDRDLAAPRRRAQHRVMLDRRDDARRPPSRGAATIAIASVAPRGEDQGAVPAQRRRDPRPRILQRGARRRGLRHAARRGWPSAAQRRRHRRRRLRAGSASSRHDRDRCGRPPRPSPFQIAETRRIPI